MSSLIPKAEAPKKRGPKKQADLEPAEREVMERAKYILNAPNEDDSETAPGELLASALARSFSLALSHELGLQACSTGRIDTTATATLQRLAAGWTITNFHIHVVARLPWVTQHKFIDAAVCAKTSCLVSRSLRANISMNAKLENS